MCPQCGTRHDDWDHGAPGQEDVYVAVGQRCVGCQVIADKQAEFEQQGQEMAGLKVALVPVAIQAAADTERDLNATKYPQRD